MPLSKDIIVIIIIIEINLVVGSIKIYQYLYLKPKLSIIFYNAVCCLWGVYLTAGSPIDYPLYFWFFIFSGVKC